MRLSVESVTYINVHFRPRNTRISVCQKVLQIYRIIKLLVGSSGLDSSLPTKD